MYCWLMCCALSVRLGGKMLPLSDVKGTKKNEIANSLIPKKEISVARTHLTVRVHATDRAKIMSDWSGTSLHNLDGAGSAVGIGGHLDGQTLGVSHLLARHVEVAHAGNGLDGVQLLHAGVGEDFEIDNV